MNDNFFVKIAF